MRDAIARDPGLRARFEGAALDDEVRVLGPLASEARAPGVAGLLLAGDAGGFVDPMTGDGVHLAMRSGVLAAREALRALETGDIVGAVSRLERARRKAFGRKLRFNRMVRRLVELPGRGGRRERRRPGAAVRDASRRPLCGRCSVSPLSSVAFVAAMVVGFMLAELRLSLRNERRLRAAGAIEPPGDVYRAMAVLYPASFVVMAIEGAWRASSASMSGDGPSSFSAAASGVVLFAASKVLKYWAIRSLGERWSFRVLVQPGRPLVRTGPIVPRASELRGGGRRARRHGYDGGSTGQRPDHARGVRRRALAPRAVRVQRLDGTVGSEPFSTDRVEKGTERVAVSATSDQRKA